MRKNPEDLRKKSIALFFSDKEKKRLEKIFSRHYKRLNIYHVNDFIRHLIFNYEKDLRNGVRD